MKSKTNKVIWFTYIQVVTSKWFALITILGVVGLFLATQADKIIGAMMGSPVSSSGVAASAISPTDAGMIVQFMIVFTLFLMILIYGSNIANSIVEEKSARIIETLLCYVKPLQLLAGKILGYVAGIITQVAIWAFYGIVLDNTIEMPQSVLSAIVATMDIKAVILMSASVVLGFIMYAFAFAALASFADNAQDSTQLMMPVGVVIMTVYFVSLGALNGVGGRIVELLAYAPFFSPIVIFVTSDLVNISWAQLVISVGTQLVEVILVAVICSKIYRRGVISYGLRKPSISGIFKKSEERVSYRSQQ